MTSMNTLLLAPALSPLDESNEGAAIRGFAQSLQGQGWDITIVIGLRHGSDPGRIGLAQRLERICVDGKELIIHEGSMDGGKIKVIAVAQGNGSLPSPTDTLKAALTLASSPQSIQVWPKTQSALPFISTISPSPATIAHITEPKTGHPFSIDGLDKASLLVLPSTGSAGYWRKAKDTKLSAYANKLFGLTPGYDSREWSPKRDSLLVKRLDPPTTDSKEESKVALRKELGLDSSNLPLIGVVSRISALGRQVGEEILKMDVQMVGIDAGPHIEALASRAPTQVACPVLTTDREKRQLRHRIIAAADFVLMPHGNSPSSQLFPCQYGTSIIARQKGEFAERLVNFDLRTLTGSGFLYQEEHELPAAVARAVAAWNRGKETRTALIDRSMALDISWETAAMRFTEHLNSMQQ